MREDNRISIERITDGAFNFRVRVFDDYGFPLDSNYAPFATLRAALMFAEICCDTYAIYKLTFNI